MRYEKVSVRHYIPLENTGIDSLLWYTGSDVQLILGTNGSGKSSLMRLLSPVCFPKTIFSPSLGYRELVVSHNNSTYTIISDYSKPTSPHLFLIDGVNANEGGTSNYQSELLETELGCTKLVLDLMTHAIRFSNMSSTPRKAFLMEINPDKIGFVFDLQKQTQSKLKICKANLSRLNERKLQLEQQLLSETECRDLQQEKKDLTSRLGTIQDYLHRLDVGLASLPSPHHTKVDESDIASIRSVLKTIDRSLVAYQDIPRDPDERKHLHIALVEQSHVLSGKVQVLSEDIERRGHDLRVQQTQLEAMSQDDLQKEIENRIGELEQEQETLISGSPSYPLTRSDLDNLESLLPELNDILKFFIHSTESLMSITKYRRKNTTLDRLNSDRQYISHKLEQINSDYDTLRARIKLTPDDLPTENCARSECVLWRFFMDGFKNKSTQLEQITIERDRLIRKFDHLNAFIPLLSQQIERQQPCREHISKLHRLSQKSTTLKSVLQKETTLTDLQINPIGLYRQVEQICHENRMYYRKSDNIQELTSLYSDLSRIKAAGDGSRDNLVISIDKEEKYIQTQLQRISDYETEISSLKRRCDKIDRFDSLVNRITTLRQDLEQLGRDGVIHHERYQLSDMATSLRTIRQETLSRLGEVEQILRGQDILQARYTEEVINQIKEIEQERAILLATEKGLETVPRTYIIPFINDLITQMNLLIEMIWTQPLTILPFPEDHDLSNYLFPFEKERGRVADISLGSEGEQELFNLVFALAVRIVLDLRDYPLFLDEAGRTFDEKHKQNLIRLLNGLIDDGIISQLFLVNHHATIHEGFVNSEVLVLKEDNIVLPTVFNTHVTME